MRVIDEKGISHSGNLIAWMEAEMRQLPRNDNLIGLMHVCQRKKSEYLQLWNGNPEGHQRDQGLQSHNARG